MYVTENTGCHTCNADWYGTGHTKHEKIIYIV